MQVRCDHCGNTVYASGSDTGIVDEVLKRAGWRSSDAAAPSPSRHLRDIDTYTAVAEELRELGMEVSGDEVSGWLADDEADAHNTARRAPRALDVVAGWLEQKEASLMPMRREIFDQLTTRSMVRADSGWQRTDDGLLACSDHCYEQLAVCSHCGMRSTADEHRSCRRYVARCTEHGAQILPFPHRP